ncbi:MAG: hypothetical protein EXQ93_02125 [Alphaproteobacteria bacterium]|nr:hypothetical protein [Alphaproteobacteria bacterium]
MSRAGRLAAQMTPAPETRAALAVLLAFFALLMPALLPYGPSPVVRAGPFVAPHAHIGAIDPSKSHDHSGKQAAIPDAAQMLAPLVPAVLADAGTLPILPRALEVSPRAPSPVATPPRYASARPRAPPAAA